jgi:hypothetical protein
LSFRNIFTKWLRMKKVVSLIFVVFLVIAVSGCMSNQFIIKENTEDFSSLKFTEIQNPYKKILSFTSFNDTVIFSAGNGDPTKVNVAPVSRWFNNLVVYDIPSKKVTYSFTSNEMPEIDYITANEKWLVFGEDNSNFLSPFGPPEIYAVNRATNEMKHIFSVNNEPTISGTECFTTGNVPLLQGDSVYISLCFVTPLNETKEIKIIKININTEKEETVFRKEGFPSKPLVYISALFSGNDSIIFDVSGKEEEVYRMDLSTGDLKTYNSSDFNAPLAITPQENVIFTENGNTILSPLSNLSEKHIIADELTGIKTSENYIAGMDKNHNVVIVNLEKRERTLISSKEFSAWVVFLSQSKLFLIRQKAGGNANDKIYFVDLSQF